MIIEKIKSYLDFVKGRKIAIYGMGRIGTMLSKELDSIKTEYVKIDNRLEQYSSNKILNKEEYYVIVTPLNGYEDIECWLRNRGFKEINDFISTSKIYDIRELCEHGYHENYGFIGRYESFSDAQTHMPDGKEEGYGEENIAAKVLNATKAVLNGQAVYERDSVLFYTPAWNYQLLASLFYVVQKTRGKTIDICDFGGAMGSTYFQHKNILHDIRWSIVEQENYVKLGQMNIRNVSFYNTISEYLRNGNNNDLLLLSSVLQYLAEPYKCLRGLLNYQFRYVIIDRTYMVSGGDISTLQYVTDEIYDACYPATLFSESSVKQCVTNAGYDIVMTWYSTLEHEEKEYLPLTINDNVEWIPAKGMLLELKD